jgi:DNA helicase II / ATP-dependent DNA helicase PcrA
MNKEDLVSWLKKQQPNLEQILIKAAEQFAADYSGKRFFPYDAKKTGEELWLLGRGKDLCYDRPTIGFNYSMWFHPKRINTFLKYFTDVIYEARNEEFINIFDLGAGTGAVLWTVGLISHGLKTLSNTCPKIRVVNIDTSPFMISYSRDYLWRHFTNTYPYASSVLLTNDYQLNSWSNMEEASASNVWLCASYLFDHSENSDAIREDFKELIEKHRPNKILLLSSKAKSILVDEVSESLRNLEFLSPTGNYNSSIFEGTLPSLTQFRNQISAQHSLNLQGNVSWAIDSLYGRVLHSTTPQLISSTNELNIFSGLTRDRKKVKLTKQQEIAASVGNRPCLIIGPAGCGKSVVITQKVWNIVDQHQYDPNLKILITSFNKSLISHLGDWMEELLDPEKAKRSVYTNMHGYSEKISYFTFQNSDSHNIHILNFDVLPTQVGKLKGYTPHSRGTEHEKFHKERMEAAIAQFVTTNNINQQNFQKILNVDFLLDEYHRVIYGLECGSAEKYYKTERQGRGTSPQMKYSSDRRRVVWGIIKLYLQNLRKGGFESFVMRRHRLIKGLRAKGSHLKFDYILVDEFQDCTQADYEIFYQLLKDNNNITFAGDLAQSLSLGTSLHYPVRSEDGNMQRFESRRLSGSYRLPMRVSECIRPFSEMISMKFQDRLGVKADIITPFKGAPPGSRPILIYGTDTQTAADKIDEVFRIYQLPLGLNEITIYERDGELQQALYQKNLNSHAEIILQTKGLEKECVVWSTRKMIDAKGEVEEFIYTILTRTVSLLIILIFPEVDQSYVNIIRTFNSERLLFWDDESEQQYTAIINAAVANPDEQDIDNSDETTAQDDNLDTVIN